MAKKKISCPECRAVLTVGESAGKVRCPKCQAVFSAPVAADDAISTKPAPARRRAADDQEARVRDDDSEAPRRRRSKRQADGMGAGVWIGIIAASLVLTSAVGVGVYFLVRSATAPAVVAVNQGAPPMPVPAQPPPVFNQPMNPAAKQAPGQARPPDKLTIPGDLGKKALGDSPNPVAYNPVPQEEPAKAEERRRRWREFHRANTVTAYDRVGKKNPKWDAEARKALEAAARLWSGNLNGGDDRVDAWKAAKRALDAGCDDPLIRYLHARLGDDLRKTSAATLADELAKAADALEASGYPAVRVAHAQHNAAAALFDSTATAEQKDKAIQRLDASLLRLAAILKDDTREAQDEALLLCFALANSYFEALGDRPQAIERVARALEATPAWQALALSVRGRGLIKHAWDARGTGIAAKVTPEGWQHFNERLLRAQTHLEDAWKLDDGRYQAANDMITVAMGLGWDHEKMDVWFQRAMKANSDNLEACSRKLTYLMPRWHGRWAETLAFGRKCVETKNWEGRLPLLLPQAHYAVHRDDQTGMFMGKKGVWLEIQELYQEYFKVNPASRYDRAMYALWAYRCGNHAEAERLFAALGADDWVDAFDSAAAYQETLADNRKRLKAQTKK